MEDQNEWTKDKDWFWEGNVQKKIAAYMENYEGFEILETADTMTKARGPDILAEKTGIKRIVSVKGFPSDKYVDGNNRGYKKRTNPNTQAKHWFSEAILDLIRKKSADQNIEIALGFPRFPRYLNLLRELQWFRETIGLFCYFVSENGEVEVLGPSDKD
jgi:hypothetical protein